MTTSHRWDDARIIAVSVARLVVGLGLAMLVPFVVAVVLGDLNDASALLLGAAVAVGGGSSVLLRFTERGGQRWAQGFATLALAWLLGALVAAIPLHLSGHYGSYLDAVFEAMAGLTTTGFTLAQDLDHLGAAMNLWRHLLQVIGGIGAVVAVLTLFVRGDAQVATSNVPDQRHERIVPNVLRTGRSVATVVLGFAVVGIPALGVAGLTAGLSFDDAAFHAFALFASAFTTGGFTTTSASVAFYHSAAVEIVLLVLMLAGALSFAIHLELWRGEREEPRRNIEVRTFAVSLVVVMAVVAIGLGRSGAFQDVGPLFRRGIFTAIAAHTTTGLTVTPGRLLATDWGLIAPAALVVGMAIGGTAGSTAGGIKTLRIGLIAKGVLRDIRRVLLPESALVVQTYHQRRRHTLTDGHVRAAATVLLLFLFAILAGAMAPLFYAGDASLKTAMFESASAVSNTGMSVGVLTPSSPALLKLLYLVQMWMGRLEFLAVFALVGIVATTARGRP